MTKNKAQSTAKQILTHFECGIPVDLLAIAEGNSITIRSQPFEDAISGVLVVANGHATISVNENHHPNRQRFTIAHELGHFLLHSKATGIFIDETSLFFRDEVSSEGSSSLEIEANAFAAELLMPEAVLYEHLGNRPIELDEVALSHLAAQFGVSVQALTIRLETLRLINT